MKLMGKVLAILICVPLNSFAADKLIFALDLIRHGDRTPISTIPSVSYQWKQGLGQLTPVGMHQEYELGKALRERYIEKTNLLPSHYEHGTLYVRSTDYERTLMSAQSLLMGLYPHGTGPSPSTQAGLPYGFQPIPIHSAPTNLDTIILHRVSSKERDALMKKYVYSTLAWQQKEKSLRPYFPRWSEATGLDIQSLDDLDGLADTLFIHELYHVSMPAGLSEEDIAMIKDAGNFAAMAELNAKEIATIYHQQLMQNIVAFMEKGRQQDATLKFVLLSAHDSTVAGALAYMGAPLDVSPPYASDLNFSLYERGAKNYIVKVTYNGKPVHIPACGGAVCSWQRFETLALGKK